MKLGGEGDKRGWDSWMASLTQWTWVWVNPRSWWWTGKPGMLQSMGSQRVRHDWATELKWMKNFAFYRKVWSIIFLCIPPRLFLSSIILPQVFTKYILWTQIKSTRTDLCLYQFSSVQLLSHVWLFSISWTAVCQASLFITNSRSLLKLMSMESVMPSNHLIFCHSLLLPPSIFPSIKVFSEESVLHIRWTKYWSFSFSISPSSEYSGLISFRIDWLDPLVG